VPSVADRGGDARGLAPGSPLRGRALVPGSKSLAQRSIVCAGLCGGTTRIAGLPAGDDARAALELVQACGARVERLAPAAVSIHGAPPGPHRGWDPGAPVEAGESGTLARLATAALALCGRAGKSHAIRARGSLEKRSSRALFTALRESGAQFESIEGAPLDDPSGWPLRVRPLGPPSEIDIMHPRSSQEVSALLIALAAYPDEITLFVYGDVPSRPYLEMTLHTLREFGVTIASTRMRQNEAFTVRGPLRAPHAPIAIEPDASSAAVVLGAACLSGGEVVVPGLHSSSRQGDVRAVEYLARFGCRARSDREGLHASGLPTRGVELDLSGEPDLAPVLAAVGACVARNVARGSLEFGASAEGITRLRGLGTLPGKESSRIEVLGEGLQAIGCEVEFDSESIAIAPGARSAALDESEIYLDPHGDHRMAFAFALLGLVRGGVRVRDPECVAKSWPSFWQDLEKLGARVERAKSR
jgi:3-phosphoshikimate 1-carboxyvinyltransferase